MAQVIQCGYIRCNPKFEYCDHVTKDCVSCEPFCKYPPNLQYCKTLCRDYYDNVIAKRITTTPVPTTPLSVNIVSTTEASNDFTSHGKGFLWLIIGLLFVLFLITVVVAIICVIRVKRRAKKASRTKGEVSDGLLKINQGGDHGDGRDNQKEPPQTDKGSAAEKIPLEQPEVHTHTLAPNWRWWLCAPCCFAHPSSSNMPDKSTQNVRNKSNTNLYSIARHSLHTQTSLENITEDDTVVQSDMRGNRRSRSSNIPDAQHTRWLQPEDASILYVPLGLSPSNEELLSYRTFSGRLLARPTDQSRDGSEYLPSAPRVQAPSSVVFHADQSERRTDTTVTVQSPPVADTAQNDPGQQVPRQDSPANSYSQVPVPAHGQLPHRPHHSRPRQQVSSASAQNQRAAAPATDQSNHPPATTDHSNRQAAVSATNSNHPATNHNLQPAVATTDHSNRQAAVPATDRINRQAAVPAADHSNRQAAVPATDHNNRPPAVPATEHSQPAQNSMIAGAADQSLGAAHYRPPARVEYSSAMPTSVAPDPNAPPSLRPLGGPSSSLQRQQPGVPQPAYVVADSGQGSMYHTFNMDSSLGPTPSESAEELERAYAAMEDELENQSLEGARYDEVSIDLGGDSIDAPADNVAESIAATDFTLDLDEKSGVAKTTLIRQPSQSPHASQACAEVTHPRVNRPRSAAPEETELKSIAYPVRESGETPVQAEVTPVQATPDTRINPLQPGRPASSQGSSLSDGDRLIRAFQDFAWLREISYVDNVWRIGYDPYYITPEEVDIIILEQQRQNPGISRLTIINMEVTMGSW